MYYVYVLAAKSGEATSRLEGQTWYIGFTADLRKRVTEHNSGKGGQTTRRSKEWQLIYYEAYLDKHDAIGREKFLKGGSGRKYLNKQLSHSLTS